MLQYLDTIIAFAAIMLGVSVLVTALTQVVNAILGLRSKSLVWGLETLLTYIDPDFKEHARKIVDKILRHHLLSHTGGRRATAIRQDEFVALLEDTMSQENFAAGIRTVEQQRRVSAGAQAAGTTSFKFKIPTEYLSTLALWFDRVMDRVSERFALRARWVTVGFALILAVALHLDAIALFEKFYSDAELRTSLVQSTGVLLDHANDAFALSGSGYTEAVARLKASNAAAKPLGMPPEFYSAAAARDWIYAQIGDSTAAAALIVDYNNILNAVLREKIGRLVNVADSIRSDLNQTRFTLIPNPYPQWPYGWRPIIGMITSMILLSLGAPFWYNVLKSLANLRPRVADIIQKEKSASPDGKG